MTARFRRLLLRANAIFLVVAGLGAWLKLDFPATFAGVGPLAPLIAHERSLGIGFIEAHGLALILGVVLWRAATTAQWHVTAAAIHLLLGSCNVAFWQLYVVTGTVPMGWVSTVIHGLLVALHVIAAMSAAGAQPDKPVATTE